MFANDCSNRMPRILLTLLLHLFLIVSNAPAQQSETVSRLTPASATKPPAIPTSSGFFEDYKALGLESSTLQPQKPVVLESLDILEGKYVRERIQVGWRPKDTFDLYVTRPKAARKPPVIIFLYSYPENATRFLSEEWYKGVAKDGYAVVGFVSALTAERAEHRAPDEWFVGLLQESLASSVHDVQMILNYLDSRGDLDMERVGMFGTGSGATIALLASAADARIKVIDVFNPWGDWPDWAAKSWVIPEQERGDDLTTNKYIDPRFLEVIAPLDPMLWLPKVKAQSLRIQFVKSEAAVPAETQKRVMDVAPDRAELNQFGDYRAWMALEHGPEMFGWLRQELQSDAKPGAMADRMRGVHFFPAESHSTGPTPTQH